MKSRELKWLQDTKSALYSTACTWLYCQKSVHACITRVTCGPCVKLESPHIMFSFVLTCPLIVSETINPNPAVPSVPESKTRLEGLKNTGIDKAPGFYPRTNLLKPGPGSSHCVLPPVVVQVPCAVVTQSMSGTLKVLLNFPNVRSQLLD